MVVYWGRGGAEGVDGTRYEAWRDLAALTLKVSWGASATCPHPLMELGPLLSHCLP